MFAHSPLPLFLLIACALGTLLPKGNLSVDEKLQERRCLLVRLTPSLDKTVMVKSFDSAAVMTKRLADSLTRTPKRSIEWHNPKEVSEAHALVVKAKSLLPSESASIAKLVEYERLLSDNYLNLKNDLCRGTKTCDHDKMKSDGASSLKLVLTVMHSIDFAEFSYGMLICFAQVLIDVSVYVGLPEDVDLLIEQSIAPVSEMDIQSFRDVREIEKDLKSMSFNAIKKTIQDLCEKYTDEMNVTSNSSDNCSMKSVGKDDNLGRMRVAAITKRLANSMTRTPKRCLEWIKCNLVAEKGLERAHTLVARACTFLPSEGEAFGKMKVVELSLFTKWNVLKGDIYLKTNRAIMFR